MNLPISWHLIRSSRQMFKKSIPIILILLFSCVEHNILFRVAPDGMYEVEYKAHGDKNDLIDFDFTLPSGEKWTINSTLDNADAESYDYTAHRWFKHNEAFQKTFYHGDSLYFESLLKHPIKVKYSNWFFWKTYAFEGRFIGRMVESKYPLVVQLIRDMENPPYGWMKEALQYLLTETLNQSNIEWNTHPIIAAELNNWIENDLQMVSDSTLFEEMDYYKNLGLDIIMQPTAPIFYHAMDSIFNILEDELEITLDLFDDSFEFQLILPGNLESTNADSLAGDTLYWSFQLEDYMNDDYIFSALSKISYPGRQKWGIIILLILIVFFIGMRNRKK